MENKEAKKFTTDIFEKIEKSKTISDLEEIENLESLDKNKMKTDGYPKIEFEIKPEEIQYLIDKNIIDEKYNFSEDITSKLTDPLSKLFYATAWKNGDLTKIKHIIKGIRSINGNDENQDNSLVFYQFGKYLTKTHGQPIIDQHVIRAFAIYNNTDEEKISDLREIEIIDKSHKSIIGEYKKWLVSDKIEQQLRDSKDYSYYIDKILFAVGKTIKFRKPKEKKI